MREKELRLALVCYGGISLAVYMHGVTKEVWHLVRASRAHLDHAPPSKGVEAVYRRLLETIRADGQQQLRVMVDIVAGASAGGVNGVFLARAVATGESLDPLTKLWLERADVEVLLDPDARPLSRFTKFWAVPIAWLLSRAPRNTIDNTVERAARAEVRRKLSQFVRARWFAPPFGGRVFSGLLLDAFEAMASGEKGDILLPPGQPIDLFVTVTDFGGHAQVMRLNSPPKVSETEHRLTFSFRHDSDGGGSGHLDDAVGLAFAARATASFPGAFPPFSAREMDGVLRARDMTWPDRDDFLSRQLRTDGGGDRADRVLVDGSVLANAPFRPAIAALKQRPARREVDRRFIYIDPKPGIRSISLTGKAPRLTSDGHPALPGFFASILKTMSDIPREQPIREDIERIEGMSQRIRRMQLIITAMRPEVEERIEAVLGRTFFLDSPTAARLAKWRAAAQARAVSESGYSFVAYSHLKLSLVVEDLALRLATLARSHDGHQDAGEPQQDEILAVWRSALWAAARRQGLDRIKAERKSGENAATVAFFRAHDVGYRIRRLRHLARRLDDVAGDGTGVDAPATEAMRRAIYGALGLYLDRESSSFFAGLSVTDAALSDVDATMAAVAAQQNLTDADRLSDEWLADALAALPRAERREMLYAYLGFPFYDAATLPLLQGEAQGEFDPIKIDRISPDDATLLRSGGAAACLKGIQFNSFGAFFSRPFRENDYLWGRIHAAERLIAIAASSMPTGIAMSPETLAELQRDACRAILDEEEAQLTTIPELFAELRSKLVSTSS